MNAIGDPVHTEVVTELDGRLTELFNLPTDEATMLRLFRMLFVESIDEIFFGPCIEGAVFEIRTKEPARLSMLDGYLTVDLGIWHFHLCIGEHRGLKASPCPPELARHRRVKRAVLFRTVGRSCLPASWGLRLWNGHDEQMITVFFPSPFLDAEGHRVRRPDPFRLALWNRVRRELLDLDVDPRDRELCT